MKIQHSFIFAFLLCSVSALSQTTNHANVEMSFAFFDVNTGRAIVPNQFSLKSADDERKEISFLKLEEGIPLVKEVPTGLYKATIIAKGYMIMNAKVIVGETVPTIQVFNLSPIEKDSRLEYQYIASKKLPGFTFINGFVVTERGQPMLSAKVSCLNTTTYSEEDGYFEISIPTNGKEGQEEELKVEQKSYCETRQTGVLIWSEGDWQTVLRMKKKEFSDDAPIVFDVSNPLVSNQSKSYHPESTDGFENFLFSSDCIPQSINVGFSSSGGNCCGTSNCTKVQSFMFEDYVKRVVPNEWIASWNTTNAFKAASVAIRSYAIYKVNHPVYTGFDICAGPCCQAFGNTNTTTSFAVDATTGFVLKKSNGDVANTEYCAESNHLFPVCADNPFPTSQNCADGEFYWNGYCFSDLVSSGKKGYGHGRGMSQRGSARWSSGKEINSCSNTIQNSSTGFGTKNWQEILSLYYPTLALSNCTVVSGTPDLTKSSESIQVNGNSVTFKVTVKNIGDAPSNTSSLGFLASTFMNLSFPSTLGASTVPALPPNSSHTITRTINLCDAAMVLNSGTYYVGYKIDRLEEVAESNEDNNAFHWQNTPITIDCSSGGGSGTGSVQAYLVCNDVIAAGGQWRIDGGTWTNTNETITNLSAGNHIMSFKDIPGWTTPPSYSISLSNSEHKIVSHPQTQYSRTHILSLSSSPFNGGSTSGAGSIIVGCGSGTNITISATPSPGWQFDNWTENGFLISINPTIPITISNDRQLVANFSQINLFNITLISNPIEAGLCCFGSWNLIAGSSVNNEAIAKPNWMFANWTENGVVVSNSSSFVTTVNANKIFYANFIQTTATEDLNLSAKIQIIPNPSSGDFSIVVDNSIHLEEIEILNMIGQSLNRTLFSSNQYSVNGNKLPNGTYIAKIRTTEGFLLSKRIIVSK